MIQRPDNAIVMPVNQQDAKKIPSYTPSKEEKDFLLKLNNRMDYLKEHRSKLMANPYDVSSTARTIEETWDYADFVALPHKYSHPDLKPWMAKNSRPLIYSKIDTALATIIAKNPEVEITARQETYEGKSKVLNALYDLSWDKGGGKQQLIKFIYDCAKHGFSVGREYHRFETREIEEITQYDPIENKHVTEKKTIIVHDEPYFEAKHIRDCWFDDRARPYDPSTMRDWFWEETFDYSTMLLRFPADKYPNIKFVQPSYSSDSHAKKDKAEVTDDSNPNPQARLKFYESIEDNEFVITDGTVLIYKAPLLNYELSCVIAMWRIRNDQTIFGIGLPEILENSQEMYDKLGNMTVNQIILAIGGSGFYGGVGNITEKDAILEPKIKKLRDADKLVFPKIPMPDSLVFTLLEDIRNEADIFSGVTNQLEGDEMNRTLGEAVLNREAGLRRLAIPLNNIEFALERHANLRINNIQRIYSQPVSAVVVRDALGTIVDEKIFAEYQAERQKFGTNAPEFIQKFPEDEETGVIFRNQFRREKLPLEKTKEGEVEPTEQDAWMEITPEEIRGEYDVRVKAMSTMPVSQALEETRAQETFNIVAPLPYTDIYKAQKRILKKRNEDPADWMKDDKQIMQSQQQAQGLMDQGTQEPGGETGLPPTEELPADPLTPQDTVQQLSQQMTI